MERTQLHIPQKSSSFSTSSSIHRDEKLCDSDRNLSLRSLRMHSTDDDAPIPDDAGVNDNKVEKEVDKEKGIESSPKEKSTTTPEDTSTKSSSTPETPATPANSATAAAAGEVPGHSDIPSLCEDVDHFLAVLRSVDDSPEVLPELPDIAIDRFASLVEKEIAKYESGADQWSPSTAPDEPNSFLDCLDRASKLTNALSIFSSEPSYYQAMNHTGAVVHHAMAFLEDEFHTLLAEESKPQKPETKTKRPPSFSRHESDRCALQQADSEACPASGNDISSPHQSLELTARLRSIAGAMISSGYETECCQVFSIARRNAMESSLTDHGFEKISIDDVLRMSWESLEGEIASWKKAFRHAITVSFPQERELCDGVFDSPHRAIADGIFRNLVRGILIQLLNFAEAVAMTKRSAEKLFKVLDMYEALRDMIPKLDEIFPPIASADDPAVADDSHLDIKTEISSVRTRLGEAAVAMFCDLESSIKSDTGKTPVPGGAVHPLTRYVMNYLKYACEYKKTLEQVFREHQKLDRATSSSYDDEGPGDSGNNCRRDGGGGGGGRGSSRNPFAAQLVEVMDLLHSNLEAKAKLYKDLALSNIFMMNNGRYIVQKIKGSIEINQLLGETWCRKKSSDLRQYHKNYQRETWSRVLGCLKDEGLQIKGSVQKPVLKERFKSFNSMLEEIHKTQSAWVVSDEQLQSELRVSVSAVVVPAYRSFLGRFSQYLDPGRQTEKYIKFGPDDLEAYIDELFDGNPLSMVRRK
ncbi:hypothetical protein HPP92_022873 [Vanilla planifolia]|uniref:Exocyst subunit Exo70 family protein n=1 Tax=Vanilla planifolia TaxID=51239 RepID=A0A835UG40_VANPL|nr:hypothetical protein HPP92_022873 [Vanilla planifolia]